MSIRHPIISVTGSSGAGTTSVKRTFERIFRREGINAAYIEGDAFHRYDRQDMKRVMAEEAERGNNHATTYTTRKRRRCTDRHRARSPTGRISRRKRTFCSTKDYTERSSPITSTWPSTVTSRSAWSR
jgi:phosphoribulokinase